MAIGVAVAALSISAMTAPGIAVAKPKDPVETPKPKDPPKAKEVESGDPIGLCKVSDISPQAGACSGFYAKNQLGGSDAKDGVTEAALLALGLNWDGKILEEFKFGEGETDLDFKTLLNGATYIGIHWGKGNGPVDTPGGVTGYYRLDLASDELLDIIETAFGSQSGARLYATSSCVGEGCNPGGGGGGGPVPEPGVWMLMILGFGGAGAMLRVRRKALA